MSRVKILLADDVELFIELEKTFFRQGEYEVLTARDGKTALDLIRSERPDAVFLDLYMPEMNGDEVCKEIKADPALKDIPVLMVTQNGREQDLERCRQAGCDDILLKPINRHLFLAAADKAIQVAARKASRVEARLEITFGDGEGDENKLTDFVVNVSTGGLFVETGRLLEVDAPLSMEFRLPDAAEPIFCKGRVAWVNRPDDICKDELPVGMGVQFTRLSVDALDQIRQFVREQTLVGYW